jgi:hypothetical protein
MACITIRWRPLKIIISMAIAAFHTRVRAGQFKGDGIVIKRGGTPPIRCMTGLAIRS